VGVVRACGICVVSRDGRGGAVLGAQAARRSAQASHVALRNPREGIETADIPVVIARQSSQEDARVILSYCPRQRNRASGFIPSRCSEPDDAVHKLAGVAI
jgi:hypothetical protein